MHDLERFALRWLQAQLAEIFSGDMPAEQAFPADLPLSKLPGQPRMRTLYAALRRCGIQTPPLELSLAQHVALLAIPLSNLVMAGMQLLSQWPDLRILGTFITSPLYGFFVWIALYIVAQRYWGNISSAATVGELALQIFDENAMFFSRLAGLPLSQEQVQRAVIRVLAEATGVDLEEITPETRLVELTE